MKRLKFSDLSKDQIANICNGCGAKGMWIQPPDFIFKGCCNHHDFKYWRGGGVALFSWVFWQHPIRNIIIKMNARLKADVQFLCAMIVDAENNPEKKDEYIIIAHNYFRAVRWFGWFAFNWRSGEKSRIDLYL